jgi:hypothetical protein
MFGILPETKYLFELMKRIPDMMQRVSLKASFFFAIFLITLSPSTYGDDSTAIDVRADQILRQMSEYLKSAKEFTFKADITYDTVMNDGQKILFGSEAKVAVRRPNLLHVENKGDEQHRQVIIDGQKATLYDAIANTYASFKTTGNLDDVLDYSYVNYGMSVPIADFVYSDPYESLIDQVVSGYQIGLHSVEGVPSHHLVFSQDSIDWQIWIEAGAQPVPRKLVISYKTEPGSPQYTATLSEWNFQPRISDHYFRFQPHPGSDEIEFMENLNNEVQP